MTQRVKREDLLKELDAVYPGLSPREIIEQSSCFVFRDGVVMTYNDEIACSHATCLELTGAVQANQLLAILRKMTEEEIEVEQLESELIVRGKNKKSGIRMEAEILLPVDEVEKPTKWKKLSGDFAEAIKITSACAGKDQSQFNITCVHVTPVHVEATDKYQISRFNVETPVDGPILIRKDSIKHIVDLGMIRMAETDAWVHFKNGAGLVLSARRHLDDYPDLSPFLDFTGKQTILPKGLGEASEKAEIFSSENVDSNQVLVELRAGKLRIRGEGAAGWYTETKKLSYDGPPLRFWIQPKLLSQLIREHNECEITEGKLKVDGGKFIYVACLQAVED